MTASLKAIFAKIDRMTTSEQNAIADLLSQEIAWQKSFYKSQKQLLLLAEEATEEYRKGKTQSMNLK